MCYTIDTIERGAMKMFAKRINNLFILVYAEKEFDEKTGDYYHLVNVQNETTLKENYLYYHGNINVFSRVSDIELYRIIEKLLVKPKNSKFALRQNIDIIM